MCKWVLEAPSWIFFSNGLNGDQKCVLITQCLNLISETGAHLLSLTFDGAPSNITMAQKLGCNMNLSNIKSYFTSNGKNVHIYFDPCHMLKLIRNTFGEKKVLKDGEGNFLKRQFIENLGRLQDDEGLHLANKLRTRRLIFFKQKMKVRLAAQLLSESVADVLGYCEEDLCLSNFQNCQGTIKFIK